MGNWFKRVWRLFVLDTINVFVPCCCRPKRKGRVVFRLGIPTEAGNQPLPAGCRRRIREETDVASDIKTKQSAVVSVKSFKDDRGDVVGVDGPPTWHTDNSDLVALEPAADGMSCKVTTGAMAGVAKVQMTADPDLSPAVKELVGVVEFNIMAREAVSVELEVSTPVDLPL